MVFTVHFLFSDNFFDLNNGKENETLEIVRLIPTTLMDSCGNDHQSHISLKCSGQHDVRQNKIKSTCTTLVPEIPTCNATSAGMYQRCGGSGPKCQILNNDMVFYTLKFSLNTGNIDWFEWESWGKCSLSCWFDANSLPMITRTRKSRSNESHTQTQQRVCQDLNICPTGTFFSTVKCYMRVFVCQ